MSATISWVPLLKNKKSVSGGNSFAEVLEKGFGGFPFELTEKDIPKLQGIEACGYKGARELADAIYDMGTILVDISY